MPTKLISWTQKVYFSNEVDLTEDELFALEKVTLQKSNGCLLRRDDEKLFDKLDKDKQQDDIENELDDIIIE